MILIRVLVINCREEEESEESDEEPRGFGEGLGGVIGGVAVGTAGQQAMVALRRECRPLF